MIFLHLSLVCLLLVKSVIESFHMTSRWPYHCPKTMKRRPCWCPKPVLWELNSFLMQPLSFVPVNLHICWRREWKHSIVLVKVYIKDLQQCIISAVLAFQSCQQMAKNQWTRIVAGEYELIKFFFFTGTVLFRVNTVTGGLSDRPLRRAGRGREKIWSPFKIMSYNLNFEFLISEMNRLLNH